jgi:hypothetical protein
VLRGSAPLAKLKKAHVININDSETVLSLMQCLSPTDEVRLREEWVVAMPISPNSVITTLSLYTIIARLPITTGGMRSIGNEILECYDLRMNVMIDATRRTERMISTRYKGNKEKSLYENRTAWNAERMKS